MLLLADIYIQYYTHLHITQGHHRHLVSDLASRCIFWFRNGFLASHLASRPIFWFRDGHRSAFGGVAEQPDSHEFTSGVERVCFGVGLRGLLRDEQVSRFYVLDGRLEARDDVEDGTTCESVEPVRSVVLSAGRHLSLRGLAPEADDHGVAGLSQEEAHQLQRPERRSLGG